MGKYDPTRLDELGQRRAQLRTELKEVSALIEAEVTRAFKAGLIQAEIAKRLQMTRESINQLCRPSEQRWKRGA
jgi:DNA-binding CsgD family transcriptional regulator